MAIHIEDNPYMESHWYKGVWETEDEEQEGYDFDLVVTTNDESSEECEVVWTLGGPAENEAELLKIEEQIEEYYQSKQTL